MAEPEKLTADLMPWWVALLLAILTGAAHAAVTVMDIRDTDGGIGYAIGSLFGAMIFAPIVAMVVSLAVRPLRTFAGFLIVYASASLLSLLGSLTG